MKWVLLILANIICVEINIAIGRFDILIMNLIAILLCITCLMSD